MRTALITTPISRHLGNGRMNNYTRLEDLIFNFCQRYQIGLIQPDHQLHYVLYVDDLEVRCFSSNSQIFQSIELNASLKETREDQQVLLKQILQNALLCYAESKVALALDETGRLCLFQRLEADSCDLARFEEAMTDLANQGDLFGEIIKQTTAR